VYVVFFASRIHSLTFPQATRDTFYLDVGMEVLADLIARSKVNCGLATLANVETDELDDRMESFVLSETLKYLYLLFDEANEFSKSDSNFIFTTEGHILLLNSTHLKPISETRRRARRHERPQCPVHQPVVRPSPHGLVYGIRSRPEYEYARHLAGDDMLGDVANDDSEWWDIHGICEVPKIDVFVSVSPLCQVSRINPHTVQTYDFFLAKEGTRVTEDTSAISLQSKVFPWMDGLLFQDVSGVRIHATSRLDGKGYDITKSAFARDLFVN
jgi:mannosidase alpha-like ER degradation enhancer 1